MANGICTPEWCVAPTWGEGSPAAGVHSSVNRWIDLTSSVDRRVCASTPPVFWKKIRSSVEETCRHFSKYVTHNSTDWGPNLEYVHGPHVECTRLPTERNAEGRSEGARCLIVFWYVLLFPQFFLGSAWSYTNHRFFLFISYWHWDGGVKVFWCVPLVSAVIKYKYHGSNSNYYPRLRASAHSVALAVKHLHDGWYVEAVVTSAASIRAEIDITRDQRSDIVWLVWLWWTSLKA